MAMTTKWESLGLNIGNLQEIHPDVFLSNDEEESILAGFVLVIAQIHNDLVDLDLLAGLLERNKLSNLTKPTSAVGLYSGLQVHLQRLRWGCLFSLLDLLRDKKYHQGALDTDLMKVIEAKMSKDGRRTWDLIKKVAQDQKVTDPLFSSLAKIRNNVSYHLSPKSLIAAHKKKMSDKNIAEPWRRLYIAWGGKVGLLRYFFADGATQLSMNDVLLSNDELIRDNLTKIIKDTGVALYQLIHAFVTIRGGCYRDPSD